MINMLWWCFNNLTSYGSGYVFPNLLEDVVVFFGLCLFTKRFVIPAINSYLLAKSLDKLFGTDNKHWFYGHTRKYDTTEKGMLASSSLYKSFPSCFNRWLGPNLSTLSAYHPDTTISVLGSGAPKNEIGYHFIRRWLGDGLLTSSGKKWQRNRRLLTPAFHYKILLSYNKVFNGCARELIKKWKSEIGNPVEISEPLSLFTLDSMMQCAMSQKTECQKVRGKHPYIEAVNELSILIATRLNKPHHYLDWIYYRTEDGKKYAKAADTLHAYTERIIKQRREDTEEKTFSRGQKEDLSKFKIRDQKLLDFLDILLQTKDEDGKGLNDSEIRDEVDTFLFEGHDTTASGLSWTVYNFAKFPDLQMKCRKEVLSVLDDKSNIECEDLSKLTYLTMFIKESMRLYPPVPFIARKLNRNLQLTHSKTPDKSIPSGSSVMVDIFSQHRNGHVWEDPLEFDPERFTPENIAKRPAHAYIPFSAGSRNCIGQNFAMNEIKVVLAQLLRTFFFYLDEDMREPMMSSRIVLRSENGIFVKFKQAD